MTDNDDDFEGFRIIDGGDDPADGDGDVDDVAPGRSVFGDDDVSFEEDDDALPHWSEPATGSVPKVGATPPAEGTADEVTFAPSSEPRPSPEPETGSENDLSAWAEVSSTPRWADEGDADLPPVEPVGDESEAADDFFAYDDDLGDAAAVDADEPSLAERLDVSGVADRDMGTALLVGVGLAALMLASMAVGPAAALIVVTLVIGLAAVEFFNTVRTAGHQPAVLLGLTAIVSLPLATYWRGESAIVLVLVLSVIFGALWYLTGVGVEAPVRGLGTTLFGIIHIGVFGSFAALMLALPGIGTGLLTAAVLVTVAYDVGALVVGRTMGRAPLSPASPNKTVEGLVGGCVAAVVVGAGIGIIGMPSPFGDNDLNGGFLPALVLGISAAVVAPIGDLAESLVKRDLGVKDMGSILPGHGGLLDRFDGLLFVLPTAYYVALMFDVGVPG